MNAVLRKNGFEAVPEAAIRSFIGSGIGKLVERAIGFALERQHSHKADASAIGREMAEYYDAHLTVHSHLYPGVRETLRECSGMTQIVVSNKPETMVRKMLAHFRIGRHFPTWRAAIPWM
ncbi:MAG: HAD hydrolase-like protein [Candidatus Marinimicrobia bacterium]|nr:HAD hydrolase-like protein [Candidatus Neomarinimicrobiota bacterium]